MSHDKYQSPLVSRYTSEEMQRNWSDDRKFGLWRRLWLAIAAALQRAGVKAIVPLQLAEMESHLDDIDYARAAELEKKLKHDVVAHAKTFGEAAPTARGIIHLGCTSCDITDNAELVQIRDGLQILERKLANLLRILARFIEKHAGLATLGRTHLQNAQPITVGRRAAMWAQDMLLDLQAMSALIRYLPFRGLKGPVGTQASHMELMEGDLAEKVRKVRRMENEVAAAFDFRDVLPITGQTYARKIDSRVLFLLADLGASVHKICLDLRHLQALKEMEEPFEESQVGSSAMPQKRNPMRSERADALAREIFGCLQSALMTQATQGFERTLDDSAGRRRYLPEAFLLADALLIILTNIFQGIRSYPMVIARNFADEMPFLASEKIIARMVEVGADRQECHERIRVHAQAAREEMQNRGAQNDLLDRIKEDPYFAPVHAELETMADPTAYIGAAEVQAKEYAHLILLHPKVIAFADEEAVTLKV